MTSGDIAAFASLPHRVKQLAAGAYITREGDRVSSCSILLEGAVIRHRVTSSGRRQVVAVQVAGDFVDLQNLLFDDADHSVQTVGKARVAIIPISAIKELVTDRSALALALWCDTLIDAAILREWLVNIGRRDAVSRIAHLLCELEVRFAHVELARDRCYEMPMTQEQIADAVGLTTIHVNRTLQELGRMGGIRRDKKNMCITNWGMMEELGEFDGRYLRRDRSPSEAAT